MDVTANSLCLATLRKHFAGQLYLVKTRGKQQVTLTSCGKALHDITKSLGKEIFAFLGTRKSQRKGVGGHKAAYFLDTI